MAFEELTSRQPVMWGSAPFENIADLISDMQVASSSTSRRGPGSSGSISGPAPAMSRSTPRARARS